jgi:hypothetical protein
MRLAASLPDRVPGVDESVVVLDQGVDARAERVHLEIIGVAARKLRSM